MLTEPLGIQIRPEDPFPTSQLQQANMLMLYGFRVECPATDRLASSRSLYTRSVSQAKIAPIP